MKYRIKPLDNILSEINNVVIRDKEIQILRGHPLKKEINKEIETWLQYGKIKPYYARSYSPELVSLIMSVINKYHKKYYELWQQGEILEKKYEETDLEELEDAYEMTMIKVQEDKNNLYYNKVLPEINKLLKENGYIDK